MSTSDGEGERSQHIENRRRGRRHSTETERDLHAYSTDGEPDDPVNKGMMQGHVAQRQKSMEKILRNGQAGKSTADDGKR
jgi:hypothetical protein